MISGLQPRFQVGEDEMDDGQKVFGDLRIATLGDGMLVVPRFRRMAYPLQSSVTVSVPGATAFSTNPQSDLAAPGGQDSKPDTPGIESVLSLVLRGPVYDDAPHRRRRRGLCGGIKRNSEALAI
jgi:hypothetical protein